MRALLGVLVALGIGAGVWLSGALTHPMNLVNAKPLIFVSTVFDSRMPVAVAIPDEIALLIMDE